MLVLVTLPFPATAGIFGKKNKPTPQERVPELIKIVTTDGDENKRADACEELRQYDAAQFPEIIPTLIDALTNDKKAGVRAEAAHSLGKIRPVSPVVGRALEKALADDTAMRVRMQCRTALLSYQWAGYRSSGKKDDPLVQTKEPPLMQTKEPPPLQTKEPPLADSPVVPTRLSPSPDGPWLPPGKPQKAITPPSPEGPPLGTPPG
jgi:hypothetical protein